MMTRILFHSKTILSLAVAAVGLTMLTAPSYAQAPQRQRPDRILVLVLGQFGWEPRSLTVPAGPADVVMHNRSGLLDVTFEFDRVDSPIQRANLHSQRFRRDTGRRKVFETLTPGEYEIRVVERPDWTLRLTVTAGRR